MVAKIIDGKAVAQHFDAKRVLAAISVDKDVDGFHLYNVGAVVIDVGINRLPDGRLVGDVDFEGVRQ